MDNSKVMKHVRVVVARIAAMAAMTAGTAFAYEYDLDAISNATAPDTVLQSGFYEVVGSVKINAKDDPGQSALRVAPGATVTINIPFGSALTVIGGPAEGMIGAGAGIEVPPDAKLLVCGYGFLYAQGGAGGAGGGGGGGGGGGAGGGLFAFGANAWPADVEKDHFDMNDWVPGGGDRRSGGCRRVQHGGADLAGHYAEIRRGRLRCPGDGDGAYPQQRVDAPLLHPRAFRRRHLGAEGQ